jgi:hypothetical protein
MEYAEFNEVSSDNAVFPFAQLPYIFGGLEYVLTTTDDIGISSKKDDTNKITVDEYRETLKDLRIYYRSVDEYFALANVCMALQQYDEAKESVNNGINDSIGSKNYRMLKFYCKQAVSSSLYEPYELRDMYRNIENSVNSAELTEDQYYNYTLHLPYARNALLDRSEAYPTLRLTLFSNISADDHEKLAELLRILDDISDAIPYEEFSKHIEIRHNSSIVADFIVSGSFQTILTMLLFCDAILSTVVSIKALTDRLHNKIRNEKNEFLEKIQALEARLKEQERTSNEQRGKWETEKKQFEMRIKFQEEEIEILKTMLSQAEMIENSRRSMQANKIEIKIENPLVFGPDKIVINNGIYNEIHMLAKQ